MLRRILGNMELQNTFWIMHTQIVLTIETQYTLRTQRTNQSSNFYITSLFEEEPFSLPNILVNFVAS
jgi:hypothetical protein